MSLQVGGCLPGQNRQVGYRSVSVGGMGKVSLKSRRSVELVFCVKLLCTSTSTNAQQTESNLETFILRRNWLERNFPHLPTYANMKAKVYRIPHIQGVLVNRSAPIGGPIGYAARLRLPLRRPQRNTPQVSSDAYTTVQ